MKIIILTLIFVLSACSNHEVISNQSLKKTMAYGTMRELNKIDSGKDKDLLVRLYQIPSVGKDCFVETHGVCQYKYYISVSTFDEFPEVNVFELDSLGEISTIKWLEEEQYDYVEIEVTLNKFTKEALNNNSSLVNVESKILLKIDINKILEEAQ